MVNRVPYVRVLGTIILAAVATALLARSLANSVQASPGDLFASPLGSGDCTQSNPCDLQTALGQAQNGDTIYLAQGTYTSTAAAVATITKSITLYGGWDGTTTSPPVRDSQVHTTTLDGEEQRRVVYIDGQYISDGPTLAGLRLINGYVTGSGGGIYSRWTSPIISSCHILTNTASVWGGGIYSDFDSDVTLIGNVIRFNRAGSDGGIYLRYATDSTLVGNDVSGNSAGSNGGGIYLDHSNDATLTDNDIYSNTAAAYGGGFYIFASTGVTLAGSRIHHNTAQSGQGGGLYSFDSDNATLTGNQIHHNVADTLGGGVSLSHSDAVILTDNAIYSNTAGVSGGGAYLASSLDATLTGNDIRRNTAGNDGAGIQLTYSDRATLAGNQVYSNTATAGGGGGLALSRSPTSTLTSNVIYSNTAGGFGGGIYLYDNNNTRLTGNWIYRNTAETSNGGGINLTASDHLTLLNNLVLENRLAGSGRGAGLAINSSTVNAVHTTLARNSGGYGQGVHVWNGAIVTMTNTILVSHTVGLEAWGDLVIMTATLWGEGTWANITDTVGSALVIVTGTINVVGDPAFLDPDSGDYHILPGSAAFNQGVDTDVDRDFDGEARVGAPDLGADEYVLQAYLPLVLRNHQ